MGSLKYSPSEKIVLKGHPDFDERWVQTIIAEDPKILGLGELILIERERRQERAGRLDLLLAGMDDRKRFEVELMLGPLDESHIIRAIEYWDIERRRYPAYDHVAVIVAEDITGRFLNVLSLLAGNIPLVAINMSAIQICEKMTLSFTKVLDQRMLRRDDEAVINSASADRDYWINTAKPATVEIVDKLFEIINSVSRIEYKPNYTKYYISLRDSNRTRRFIQFIPQKTLTRIFVDISDPTDWIERIQAVGFPVKYGDYWVDFNVLPDQLETCKELLKSLLQQAVEESQR